METPHGFIKETVETLHQNESQAHSIVGYFLFLSVACRFEDDVTESRDQWLVKQQPGTSLCSLKRVIGRLVGGVV